jgi:hypothetical protein
MHEIGFPGHTYTPPDLGGGVNMHEIGFPGHTYTPPDLELTDQEVMAWLGFSTAPDFPADALEVE